MEWFFLRKSGHDLPFYLEEKVYLKTSILFLHERWLEFSMLSVLEVY